MPSGGKPGFLKNSGDVLKNFFAVRAALVKYSNIGRMFRGPKENTGVTWMDIDIYLYIFNTVLLMLALPV